MPPVIGLFIERDLQVFPHILDSDLLSRCCDLKLNSTIIIQSLIRAFAWLGNALILVFQFLLRAGLLDHLRSPTSSSTDFKDFLFLPKDD